MLNKAWSSVRTFDKPRWTWFLWTWKCHGLASLSRLKRCAGFLQMGTSTSNIGQVFSTEIWFWDVLGCLGIFGGSHFQTSPYSRILGPWSSGWTIHRCESLWLASPTRRRDGFPQKVSDFSSGWLGLLGFAMMIQGIKYAFGGLEHCLFSHIFGTFWNNHPHWLIFFRGVETTNQMKYGMPYGPETIPDEPSFGATVESRLAPGEPWKDECAGDGGTVDDEQKNIKPNHIQKNPQNPHTHTSHMTGWCFGTFFIFPYVGNNYSSQLTFIFFRGV